MDTDKQLEELIGIFEEIIADKKIEWLQGVSISNIDFSTNESRDETKDLVIESAVAGHRVCRIVVINGRKVTICR